MREDESAMDSRKRVLKDIANNRVFSITLSCWGLILVGSYLIGLIIGYGSLTDTLQHLTQPSLFVPLVMLSLSIPGFMIIGHLYQKQQNLTENLEQLVEKRTNRLRESEEKYRSLVENIPDVTWTLDREDNTIFVSSNVEKILGFTSEEIYQAGDRFWEERTHPDDRERVEEAYYSLFDRNKAFDVEHRIQRKDGRWIWIRDRAIATYEKDGLMYTDGIFLDITERRQIEKKLEEYSEHLEEIVEKRTEQLKKAQEQTIRAERFAAIGELASMIGHDLRNPLTGIATATYYLKTRLGKKGDKKMKEMLEIIEKSIEHSNKIMSDLLNYSKEIRLELTDTTPKTIMKEALFLNRIPKNIQIVDETRSEPKIKVDVDKTIRVFGNLIKNAIDAMPEGGKLTTKSKKLGNNVEIDISDTGTGIPKDVVAKIWTPLFTTKAKGIGLGLPICKRIVETHGGNISVETTVGKGTTFTVTIPIEPKLEGGEKIWVNVPESLLSTTMKT